MNEILKTESLSAGYGRGDIISEITLSAAAGETVALVGPNGSGKTTLVKAICGLIGSRGGCSVCGREIRDMTPQERSAVIGYVSSESTTSLDAECVDVVLMGIYSELGPFSEPCEEYKKRAEELLKTMGVGDLAREDFQKLSSGQKQTVMLARAFLRKHGLTVLDEPDASLDISKRKQFMSMLRDEVKKSGSAAVICSHDLNLMLGYADRIVFMRGGRIVGTASPGTAGKDEIERLAGACFGPMEAESINGKIVVI